MHGGRSVTSEDSHFGEKWNKNSRRPRGRSSPESSISEDRCQKICHSRGRLIARSRELPKVEASEFIVIVGSGGRVSGDMTLQKDFTSEVCVCEYFGIRRSTESRSNCGALILKENGDR
jgi:hypothetical protein